MDGINDWIGKLCTNNDNEVKIIKMLTILRDIIPEEEFIKYVSPFNSEIPISTEDKITVSDPFGTIEKQFVFIEAILKETYQFLKIQPGISIEKCNKVFMTNNPDILCSAILLIALTYVSVPVKHNEFLSVVKAFSPILNLTIEFAELSTWQKIFGQKVITEVDNPSESAVPFPVIPENNERSDRNEFPRKKKDSPKKKDKKEKDSIKNKDKKEKNSAKLASPATPSVSSATTQVETLPEKVEAVLDIVEDDLDVVAEMGITAVTAVLAIVTVVAETVEATQEGIQAIKEESLVNTGN
jgi:hypothetical protein